MREGETPFHDFLRQTLCRVGGHPSQSQHRLVLTKDIVDHMALMAADPDTKVSIIGKCTFCDEERWKFWPSIAAYLREKGGSDENS